MKMLKTTLASQPTRCKIKDAKQFKELQGEKGDYHECCGNRKKG